MQIYVNVETDTWGKTEDLRQYGPQIEYVNVAEDFLDRVESGELTDEQIVATGKSQREARLGSSNV